MGNTIKAVKYLYKSYEKDPNVNILFEISDIYFEVKDYQRSIIFLKKVLLHDEKNTESYSRIGEAYLNSSKWHDATEYAKIALEISKKVPRAYITLAQTQFQLEQNLEKCIEIIDEGLSENPESAELWAEKGGFSFDYDMFAFKKSYEKAISMNPTKFEFYKSYIFLLLISNEIEEAKKQYNQMLLFNPLYEKSFEEIKSKMFL